jgi:hypothetical protein
MHPIFVLKNGCDNSIASPSNGAGELPDGGCIVGKSISSIGNMAVMSMEPLNL